MLWFSQLNIVGGLNTCLLFDRTMYVQQIDGWRFIVQAGIKDCVVDLEHRKCDCGVYGVEKIPCSHAIAARSYASLHISTLLCPVYSKDTLFAGYSENIYPCAGQQVEARTCFPPEVKRGTGRQKKSRWQSWLELSRMRGRTPRKQHMVYRCSVCKKTGHTCPHCKNWRGRPSRKSSRRLNFWTTFWLVVQMT